MRIKSAVLSVVCIVAVAGSGIGTALTHQAWLRLAAEHQALEQQLGQMAELSARNAQLSLLLAKSPAPPTLPEEQNRELLRLRGEVGRLRQQTQELETARAENRQAHAALDRSQPGARTAAAKAAATADYWPQDSWAFTGYATPDAALQTSFWAANNGDLKALATSTTGKTQAMIEKDLGGKSEAEAAIRAMDEVLPIKSVRILNREPQGDDTVVLTAVMENPKEPQPANVKMIMKRIGNDWKLSDVSHDTGPAE